MHTLVAGCGDVGCRLGVLLSRDGERVTGLRRDATGIPPEITPLAADLTRPGSLAGLNGPFDQIVFLPTPDARVEESYVSVFRNGLLNLREALPDFAGRLIAVSSTSVYGDQGGAWVDENTQPDPTAFNGRVLLAMEQDAARLFPDCVIVRFSGIYGPGRNRLIRTVKDGSAFRSKVPPLWTNRIHVEDAAGVLQHILGLPKPEHLYLASDDRPALRGEVLNWLAGELGVPGAEARPGEDRVGGKRIDTARLRRSGCRMHYPDFRSGYRGMLAEATLVENGDE